MGIPQLVAAANTAAFPPLFNGSVGAAAIICVEDLLLLLAETVGLLTAFKTILRTLIIFINLSIKTLELFVDTLILQVDLLLPLVQEYQAVKAKLASELGQFGLSQFTNCPPVLALQNAMIGQASGIPVVGAVFKGVRNMEALMMKYQLTVVKLQEKLTQINVSIARNNALVIFLQGMIDAIDAQFPGA